MNEAINTIDLLVHMEAGTDELAAWLKVRAWAELGAKVEAMPHGSELHRSINDDTFRSYPYGGSIRSEAYSNADEALTALTAAQETTK